jgi:hypothetical protein
MSGKETDETIIGKDFWLIEFDALRREIELHVSERRKIESQVVVGLAALYAWAFSLEKDAAEFLFHAVLSIPPILILLSFFRWSSIHLRTMKIGEYIRKREEAIFSKKVGWETYIANERASRPIWGQFEGWTEFLVWLVLFGGSLVVLALFPQNA